MELSLGHPYASQSSEIVSRGEECIFPQICYLSCVYEYY